MGHPYQHDTNTSDPGWLPDTLSVVCVALTRRGLLLGSAGIAVGTATTACGLIGSDDRDGALPAKEVVDAVRNLVNETGRDAFQRLQIPTDSWLTADLLMADGGVQEYTMFTTDGWKKGSYRGRSLTTSPSSATVADLRLDLLAAYRSAVPGYERLVIDVDYIGKVRVSAFVKPDLASMGVNLDGKGTLPQFDYETVSGVRGAIAEILAGYGSNVERVGSFNGFVHVDAAVTGHRVGVRIVRYPTVAPQASLTDENPFAPALLFDPTGFDPTMALSRMKTIAQETGVSGKVWDWRYSRPQPGAAPAVSYGIGPDVPNTRVWLDSTGKVSAVVSGKCKSGTGWCPN